jgi:hypothetical protein
MYVSSIFNVEYCSVADPGSGMGEKSRSGPLIWIRDEHPGSYFRESLETIFWLKILNFLRDPVTGIEKNSDPE